MVGGDRYTLFPLQGRLYDFEIVVPETAIVLFHFSLGPSHSRQLAVELVVLS